MQKRMNIIGGAIFDGWTCLIDFFVFVFSVYIVYLLDENMLSWILFGVVASFGITLFMSITGILIDF